MSFRRFLSAIFLFALFFLFVPRALAEEGDDRQTFSATTMGLGFSYAAFVADEITESNVGAFVQHAFPVGYGTFSGETEETVDGPIEIWNPNYYALLGWTIQGAEVPIQGVYLGASKRMFENFFVGLSAQAEKWDGSLFGDGEGDEFGVGGRFTLETPPVIDETPLQLTVSACGGQERTRVEVSITAVPILAGTR